MTKTIHLSLTVPDEIDPEEILETMCADFFYNNRGALPERFPEIEDLMSKIVVCVVHAEKTEQGLWFSYDSGNT